MLERALEHAENSYICTLLGETKNTPSHQSLLEIYLDNSGQTMYARAAYVQVDKAARRPKFADHTKLGVYSGTLKESYRIQLLQFNQNVHCKHVEFDEYRFPAEYRGINNVVE